MLSRNASQARHEWSFQWRVHCRPVYALFGQENFKALIAKVQRSGHSGDPAAQDEGLGHDLHLAFCRGASNRALATAILARSIALRVASSLFVACTHELWSRMLVIVNR